MVYFLLKQSGWEGLSCQGEKIRGEGVSGAGQNERLKTLKWTAVYQRRLCQRDHRRGKLFAPIRGFLFPGLVTFPLISALVA